ncbi:MAG: glycogen synthase GlgA [Oscillospiraceae bacterium]|nr:glycogen synthase GlgA [Oscillospiraceae bacterium]MCI8878909.1 glycogen synthase GlgA [Oscillospiraceae bacterium]
MKILFAASEAVPFCKTGGLADVAGSLPQALAASGDEVEVIVPLYQRVADGWKNEMTFVRNIEVPLGWRRVYCGLFRLEKDGVIWYFVDNEYYFKRDALYGHYDDGERFGFFSRAIVALLPSLEFMPEVIHCNDWQTALVPIYLKDECVRWPGVRGIKTVFTIHNVEYQGRYGKETLEDLFGLAPGWFADGTIAMDGDVNLLKGALMVCDAITAVSPTYAQELRHAFFAHGMQSVIERNAGKLHGVLNGIDMERYDPSKGTGIQHKFSAKNMAGKAKNKAWLQEQMHLTADPDVPIIGIVSRLVSHKGLDLIGQVFDQMMDLNCQFVVLGSGDWNYEQFFEQKRKQYDGRMGLYRGYNENLANAIYAGADLLLMPSKSEPCGLAQMIAMRYGTVPIVRETGGLKDTVHPYEAWCGAGNGFTFADYNSGDMLYVIRQAVDLYYNNPTAFKKLRKTGMAEDFSWANSANSYHEIYKSICG